ncbi:hypothetical protein M2165_001631 [Variovorax sp. TBS-050B]|uniref:hypothetical protein n=1 Tax=Variovorax sp. TBS-050B TaxID=2940551 RepID=UPI0024766528|nr:hypothetical protein [Variovorax sp. TBS-050B]MDH6591742.1 hypothetical protein [Variovorax sp. TBS-050B]
MTPRPRTAGVRTAAVAVAALPLLLVGGCSHYHVGIPLVPGLSLGLGATKDGNFSVGLNTGWGPLGAGVSVNNTGVVAGTAGVGVGVGIGPIGTGVGVGKSVVLHDPNAGKAAAAPVATTTVGPALAVGPAPATAATTAAAAAPVAPVRVVYRTPRAATAPAPARELGTPFNPIAP